MALGDAEDDLMVQNHRAIHHELHKPVPMVSAAAGRVGSGLRGDQAREPEIQQPGMQTVYLPPFSRRILNQVQKHIQGVEDDSPGPHELCLGHQSRQEAAEVEVPRLDNVGARLGIHDEEPCRLQDV